MTGVQTCALPISPSSTITVTLEDISKVSISSSILGQKTIVANVAPPYNISIQYDPSLLTADGQYVLKARIEHEGKPLYSSIYPIPALSELSGQVFELIVNATPQPAAEGVDDIHPQLPVPPAE